MSAIVDDSDLMAAFAKRKCAVCAEQAEVFSPGDNGERAAGVAWLPNRRPKPDLNLCFVHALSTGWPWQSEPEPQACGSVAQ